MPHLNSSEKYTWECLWQDSCEGCMVSSFVKKNGLDDSQQGELLSLATAAGAYLTPPGVMTRKQVIELLAGSENNDANIEEVTVAVDGWLQWNSKGCRDSIRQGVNNG